jgi:hypothetical protein
MAAILLEADEIIVKPFAAGKLTDLLREKMLKTMDSYMMVMQKSAAA